MLIAWHDYGVAVDKWGDWDEWLKSQKGVVVAVNEKSPFQAEPQARKASLQLDLGDGVSVAVVVQEGGPELAWIRNHGGMFGDGASGLAVSALAKATRRCRELVAIARGLLEA